ncbi:hypothetical protein QBC47DRAFT_419655 [Echria macrotheca]|uniref:Uncharacterized protein n=1 Tax=Echria macrotheca TaxID=438768 RepID=A0AAJ0FFC8_9PEZI|nr:hypothetical protein QBC47DRAFT_419655 [Echria macrotheca]
MAHHVYTVPELMRLRANKIYKDVSALAENPDIANIVRHSCSSEESQAKSRSKDTSSSSSEELLFKGNANRRAARPNPREVTQEPFHEMANELAREPVRAVAHEPSREQLQQGDYEWKYQGRNETEAVASEPLSAPTGIPAQRSEGFQRFYKAVVSPTHVRVTAGGRIVPNTRAPSSPTSKRLNDSGMLESGSNPDKLSNGKLPLGQPTVGSPMPILPQFMPGFAPGFQPIQTPVSFVPMAFGPSLPPGFPYGQHAANGPTLGQPIPDNTLKDMHNTKPTEARVEPGPAPDKQDKVRVAPPEFFDYTKPFFYNGQCIYPVPAAAAFPSAMTTSMVPISMVGLPPGAVTQASTQVPQAGLNGVPNSVSNTPFPGPGQSLARPPSTNHVVPVNTTTPAQLAAPISSIKPSEITRKQIHSFKQSLKYHEDQLQYNRHQIDERDMENKIQILRSHIQRFETTLKTQLEYEASVLGQSPQQDKQSGASPPEAAKTQPAPAAAENRDPHQNQNVPAVQIPVSHNGDTAHRRRVARMKGEIFGPPGDMRGYLTDAGARALNNYLNRLPTDAALAPVFTPRGYDSSLEGSQNSRNSKDGPDETEQRLDTQRSISPSYTAPQPSDTTAGSTKAVKSNKSHGDKGLGVPYLLGTLPRGVNPRTATDQDYVYNRPLTEEERRARFLYWGKAPKSAVRGLPKYDGKHFYPPSPAKGGDSDASQESSADLDPFRPITPGLHMGSEDNESTVGRKIREPSAETMPVGFHDRRLDNKSGGKIWPTMMKKGSTSSAVSSTTAQGHLPQYSGHAAAALSPSVKGLLSPSHDNMATEFSDPMLLSGAPERRGENLAPHGVGSLEDQFKNLSARAPERHDMPTALHL